MQRNSFLKLLFGAGLFSVAPFSADAKRKRRIAKGFKVDTGKDRFDEPQTVFGTDVFYTKVSTKDTEGDIYMFESNRMRKEGPPLHYHPHQDEWWYVLSGEFVIKIGDEQYTARAGDSVFGPRGVPHTFAKTSDGEAKLLMFFQPAGKMEEYFKALSAGSFKDLSNEERINAQKRHGFIEIGPPLTVKD